MTKLYITRHGQTEWNLEGRIQGQKDSKLTELGETQAKWLGEKLNEVNIDVIVSSSSGRAVQTAEIIRGDREIKIIYNDNLKEIGLGEWEGQLHTEIKEHSPEEQRNFWEFPHLYKPCGGETFSQVITRASKEVEKIISKYEGKNILIVTHAITLKSLITYFRKKNIEDFWTGAFMHSTCLTVVEVEKDNKKIILEGDTSHYKEESVVGG